MGFALIESDVGTFITTMTSSNGGYGYAAGDRGIACNVDCLAAGSYNWKCREVTVTGAPFPGGLSFGAI